MSGRNTMSSDLKQVLARDEDLLWHGEPDRRSHIVGWVLSGIPVLFFFGPFVFFASLFVVFMIGIALDAGLLYLLVGVLAAIGLTLAVVFGGCYLLARRAHKYAEYAVTDRRLIRFSGILGRDYSTVDWTDVEDFEVDVGLLDDRFGTGSVSAVTAGSGGVTFSNIIDPYDVLKTIESVRRGDST